MNPVVLCGSGPSLASAPWDRLPYPKAAMNRAVLAPGVQFASWFMVDCRMEERLPFEARAMMRDASILKVLPAYRKDTSGMRWIQQHGQNLEWVRINQQMHQDRQATVAGRRPFDGKLPLFKMVGLTMTFALQVLTAAHSDVILAGCDLDFEGKSIHFDGLEQTNGERSHERYSLDLALKEIKTWLPAVQQQGKRWWLIGGGRLAGVVPQWPPLASPERVG